MRRFLAQFVGPIAFTLALLTSVVVFQNCGGATGGSGALVIPTSSQSGIFIPNITIGPSPTTTPGGTSGFSFDGVTVTSGRSDPTFTHFYHSTSAAPVDLNILFKVSNPPAGILQGNYVTTVLWPERASGALGTANFSGNTLLYHLAGGMDGSRDTGVFGIADAYVYLNSNQIANLRYASQCLAGGYECRFFKLNKPTRPRVIGMKATSVPPGQPCPSTSGDGTHLFDTNNGAGFRSIRNQFSIMYNTDETDPSKYDTVCYYFRAIDPTQSSTDNGLQCKVVNPSGVVTNLVNCSEVLTQSVNSFGIGQVGSNLSMTVTGANGTDTASYKLLCELPANGRQTCGLYPIEDTGAFVD